jgi:four helix bundle protein
MSEPSPTRIRTYRDLVAWQVAMDLVEMVYRASAGFPDSERYGLTSQIRRASVSVPANIAEGFGRGRKAEFRRFLEISRGSLFELQTLAELGRRLGWIKGQPLEELRDLAQRVDAVLKGLINSVKARAS